MLTKTFHVHKLPNDQTVLIHVYEVPLTIVLVSVGHPFNIIDSETFTRSCKSCVGIRMAETYGMCVLQNTFVDDA